MLVQYSIDFTMFANFQIKTMFGEMFGDKNGDI